MYICCSSVNNFYLFRCLGLHPLKRDGSRHWERRIEVSIKYQEFFGLDTAWDPVLGELGHTGDRRMHRKAYRSCIGRDLCLLLFIRKYYDYAFFQLCSVSLALGKEYAEGRNGERFSTEYEEGLG